MSTNSNNEIGSTGLQARRLLQFAGLMLAGIAVVTAISIPSFNALTYAVLGTSTVALLVCIALTWQARVRLAGLVLWSTIGCMVSVLMWLNQGLHGAVLLAFPVLLIGTGQMLRPRHFLAVVGGVLLVVLATGLSTIHGLRTDRGHPDETLYLYEVLIILAISGGMVWLVSIDLRSALARLQLQITQAQESEKTLVYLAQHDALTHLPNRALGPELLEQAMHASQRNGHLMALLFVDLDNFKDINDSLGHSAGDDFLRLVAQRLRSATRKSDIVCRHGGDEFLIGLVDVKDSDDISAIANNVLNTVTQTCHLRDTEIVASCSIGIAVHPQDGALFEDLLRHADLAMYQAKEAGRNTYRFFDDELNASVSESLYLIATLRTAIAQKEFVLYYQPVLNLYTGALVGAEALVRWQNPKLGLVSPALFIPAAEKSGLIVDIGQWVMEEACRQMQAWRNAGAPPLTIAVNLSPVQFRRGDVEGVIERALKKSGLPPECLELEVTESTLVQDTEKFIQSLQRIKALGIRISIDDFGTGYSNLSYLQRFAVDKLKIDQSFVKRLLNGPQELAIVTAIIQMAKSLNLKTNAEGVEDAQTRDLLAQIGCDLAQGYFYARPLTATQFEDYMDENLAAASTISPGLVS